MRTSSYPAYPMNFPRGCRNLSLPFCLFPTVNRAERPAQLGSCRIQRKIHNRQRTSTTFHSPVAGEKRECARRARRYVKTCQPCESYEQSVAYASPRSNVPFAADFHLFACVRFYSWHDHIRSFNKWLLSSREGTLIRIRLRHLKCQSEFKALPKISMYSSSIQISLDGRLYCILQYCPDFPTMALQNFPAYI